MEQVDSNQSPSPDSTPVTRRKIDAVALAKLFDEWMSVDEAEQRETFEFLREALDADRAPGYKLFSKE